MADLPLNYTICGLSELSDHSNRPVTRVLSILDPGMLRPEPFDAYPSHERLTLHFHDIITPIPGLVAPGPCHVEALLEFGRACSNDEAGHILVHCHMGISRSTAAATALLLQARPYIDDEAALAQIARLRPRAWPNSRMIAFADEILGRRGKLTAALTKFYRAQLVVQPDLGDALRTSGRGAEVDMATA